MNTNEISNEFRKCLTRSKLNDRVKLVNVNDTEEYVRILIAINSKTVIIITDFKFYCYAESLNIFNISIITEEKTIKNIILCLQKQLNIKKIEMKEEDPFNIYYTIKEMHKVDIDYNILENYIFTKSAKIHSVPKEYLLAEKQLLKLMIKEIKTINQSKQHGHIVIPNNNNPFNLTVRIVFNKDTVIGKQVEKLEDKYMEFNLIIDTELYPFAPPKIIYTKPNINISLFLSICNIDILKLDNWNPTINLDFFIVQLCSALEKLDKEYIEKTSISDFDSMVIQLCTLTQDMDYEKIKLFIDMPKNIVEKKSNAWKAGTGYGNNNVKEWDIKDYIKKQELHNQDIFNILNKILDHIKNNNSNDNILLTKFIIKRISGLTLLELEKNRPIYKVITDIIHCSIVKNILSKDTLESMTNAFMSFHEEVKDFIDQLIETDKNIFKLADRLIKIKTNKNIPQIVSDNTSNISEYCNVMKKVQFGHFDLPQNHLYYTSKDIKPLSKSIMRILSEISSFKTGLPLNWDSTIFCRVSKTNFNIFSFLISGPKDTPYENGLFEFHAYFPPDYPNTAPSVLINNTDGGNVRFNPNLYANGKVCLSLLGTWSGQEGEKWNPQTSTFLQVMVSIQSLILVDDPYFNEPGYEYEMKTLSGKKKSQEYNEEKQYQTMLCAMIQMIQKPPIGFEEVVKEHFTRKKEEIIARTLLWKERASLHKAKITENRNKLLLLL